MMSIKTDKNVKEEPWLLERMKFGCLLLIDKARAKDKTYDMSVGAMKD